MQGLIDRRRPRIASTITALSLAVGAFVAATFANSPGAAAAIDQRLTITQMSSQYVAPGVTVRQLRITNEAGLPVPGVACFAATAASKVEATDRSAAAPSPMLGEIWN